MTSISSPDPNTHNTSPKVIYSRTIDGKPLARRGQQSLLLSDPTPTKASLPFQLCFAMTSPQPRPFRLFPFELTPPFLSPSLGHLSHSFDQNPTRPLAKPSSVETSPLQNPSDSLSSLYPLLPYPLDPLFFFIGFFATELCVPVKRRVDELAGPTRCVVESGV